MAKKHRQPSDSYAVALQHIEDCRSSGDTELILRGLQLRTLPPEIGQLTALTELDLSHNQLSTLPPEISQLAALTHLLLGRNQLSTLPPEVGQLTALTLLDLSGNQLSTLPPEIGQLSALYDLFLYENQLTVLPPEIGRLTNLTRLLFPANRLSALPLEIGQLRELRILHVGHRSVGANPIKELPSEIGQLTKLEEFEADGTSIVSLPDSMRQCLAIGHLSFQDSHLGRLPGWLRDLPNLTQLKVNGCSQLDIPPEIVSDATAQEILDYYFSREEQGERPLNEVKLLLVGRGEAGKTCVSRALRGLEFDSGQKETAGIEIQPWKLECPDDDPIKVHLWDFAGQEITHETHRFFLTERSLYVVVLDGRSGQQMEAAEYWLSHVERFGTRHDGNTEERSPAIVVLNKWESPGPYDIERSRLQREYPNIKAFVMTDCHSRLGIEELKETIRAVVNQMPSVRQTWPISYYNVRRLLDQKTDQGEHFMTWADFRKACVACGEENMQRQHSMAENLNALGVALYYGEDGRLRDTRVLNPNWAANGLYGLLRGVNQSPHNGEPGHLWAGEFAKVLAEGMKNMESARGARIDDYPEERGGVMVHDFLLGLMVDRELGFQAGMSHKQPVYLLPGLLALDEPEPAEYDLAAHIEGAEVRFRYVYEMLPAGVMSRFIVRTHPLSEGLHRWQRGVVLGWGEAKGLVLCKRRGNPRMDVYIRGGTAEERQALAGVVRTNLEVIHRGLPDGLRGDEELDLSPAGDQYEKVTKLVSLEREGKPVQVMTPHGSVDLPVEPELGQVQPANARRLDAPGLKVFVSYAHGNYKLWDKLRVHLDILTNEGLVKWWFDGKIRPGTEWDDTIRRELKEADIVVLMLSNEFFASRYIKGVELKEAMKRKRAGQAEVLPVLLENSPAFEEQTWLKMLQTVPVAKGRLRPLNGFNPRVTGWNKVQMALRETIAEVAARRRSHGFEAKGLLKNPGFQAASR